MNTYFENIGIWPKSSHTLLYAYAAGFGGSLVLTFVAYFLATDAALSQAERIAMLFALACLQCSVQAAWFLHLDFTRSSRVRLLTFGFAIVVVGILVSGSMWIMFNLNQRMMPNSTQMQQYMNSQSGL